MTRTLWILALVLALAATIGATAANAEAGDPPLRPDLCDGAECGQPPPPPPPPAPPPAPPPPPPPEPSYLPIGWLDAVDAEGTAYGWTCDPNNFAAPLEVHFYVDGGTFVGAAIADGLREPAVAGNCGGHAHHGFAFSLPVAIRDGQSHALSAYAINIGPPASNPILAGSPQWFQLAPPPDLNAPLWAEEFTSTSSEVFYAGGVRCKQYAFMQHYSQAGLYRVLRYEGTFGVCYRYNGGIVSVQHRSGDAYWTCCGWEWRGNETGYPYHTKMSRKVTFYFRGKMAFCFLRIGCGPQRYPWVTITFFDNNTVTRSSGVA